MNNDPVTSPTRRLHEDRREVHSVSSLGVLNLGPSVQHSRRVYALAAGVSFDRPVGGVKMLYRHVDILNQNGIEAYVLQPPGLGRYRWATNSTPIIELNGGEIGKDDVLLLPEILGPRAAEICRGVDKVIYNQSGYMTFTGYSPEETRNPYGDNEVIATIVCSRNSWQYLRHAFPDITLFRLHHSVDPSMFRYRSKKRQQICYMPRKRYSDILQVIQILRCRGLLRNFDVVSIDQVSDENEVARIMSESVIFLSGGTAEGFGLPAAEAMACGCVVVGYHGGGGKEFFCPDFSYPVPEGDVRTFAKVVENLIKEQALNPLGFADIGRAAAAFIREKYSPVVEQRDTLRIWQKIFEMKDRIRSDNSGAILKAC
jgi:Glycosyl transferases group 1